MTSVDKRTLKEYLQECSKYSKIDVDRAYTLTKNFIKYHNKKEVSANSIVEMLELESRWYQSLKKDSPDYSVYSDPNYFCEVWLCWINYSKRYLKDICKQDSLFNKSIVEDMTNVKTVIDLGCSFGYTTALLKQIFKDASVYGTNLKDSSQYIMAEECGKECEFTVIEDVKNIKADLIFASEYFEHFERPIEHLEYVIKTTTPRYLLIANTFNGRAIGHFDTYKHHNLKFNGKKASEEFNAFLRGNSYKMIETNCWNNKPQYWKREDTNSLVNFFQ